MPATLIGAKRSNLFVIDPWEVRIIWDDSDPRWTEAHAALVSPDVDLLVSNGEEHALYDDRVLLPRDDAKIAHTIKHGIEDPIVIRKDGERAEVIDGRQRLLDARAANMALEKQGEPLLKIKAVLKRGNDQDAMRVMVSNNEFRTPDEVFNKAKKANRLIEAGMTEDEVAQTFRVVPNTIRNWLKLLEMDDKVQKAARSGQVTITEAIKWSKEDRSTQREMLKAHVKATKTRAADPYKSGTKRKSKKAGGKQTGAKTQVKAPTRAKIRLLIEALPKSKTRDALQWAVGDISTKKAQETIKELKK